MVTTLGGIGLFLLGMLLLTDGIKALAGTALRDVLTRFVRGPFSAMASGATLTTVLQSSSATMLTTIGFVSAGLITFPQAIGVIFGANLGTTSTGWIVSLLGFKFSMGSIALPLVTLGALMRLLLKGKASSIGIAIAGFGLLFFGIGLLQEGMSGLAERIDPASLPGDGVLGKLLLVLVGIAMTVVMQSSSAAMAVTLAALHTGGIDIAQGAALVIGQNIGTTVKSILASIGGSNAVKRTAAAHIFFNLVTGVVAFALLPVFDWVVRLWEARTGDQAGVGTLAGFHTAFNLLGVLIFLPILGRFSRLIERIVPDKGSQFAKHLDPSVANLGPVALEAARRSLTEVLAVFVSRMIIVSRGQTPEREQTERFDEARAALPKATEFVARIGAESGIEAEIQHQIGLVHAIDHLEQLGEVVDRLDDRPKIITRPEVEAVRVAVEQMLLHAASGFTESGWTGEPDAVAEESRRIAEIRRGLRKDLLERTARGALPAEASGDIIETVRWLDAIGYHTSRALHYLKPASSSAQPPTLDSSSAHRE